MMLLMRLFGLLIRKYRNYVFRLTPFVLSVTLYALPFWSVCALIVVFVEGAHEGITTVVLFRELVVGGSGFFFTFPATMGIHYVESPWHLAKPRYTLGVLWALVVSVAWWQVTQLILTVAGLIQTVPRYGLLVRGWASIALIGLLFYMTYVIRNYVALKVEARRAKAFELHPKALALGDQLDVFGIIASLDGLRRAYRGSRGNGDKLVEALQHELRVSLDPRYTLPMPLPIALNFLHRELELRRKTSGWPMTIEMQPEDSFPAEFAVEPSLLCAAGAFMAEYGFYHGKTDLMLSVIFQGPPVPFIEIRTNLKGGDLWFILDDRSPAQEARQRLVGILNRHPSKGSIFEAAQDLRGFLLFRISVLAATEATWEKVVPSLGYDKHLLAEADSSEGGSRVYGNGGMIHKIQPIGRRSSKPLILAEEYNILRRLEGIAGVPDSPVYEQRANFEVLSYDRVPGTPIREYLTHRGFERQVWFHCIAELSALLNKIHNRGVLHRDLSPDNILVQEDGGVCLIDFDQAVAGVYGGREVDTKGERYGAVPPCVAVRQLIDLLGLGDEYATVVKELRLAWQIGARSDASSPGHNLAYYSWVFGDLELPGERDWFSRWDMIYTALRQFLPGAHVLDLGCNMGLVASHCMMYGAEHATAVDIHDDVLEAGSRMAKAAGVSIDFLKGNLDSHDFVNAILERRYDLVIALSVVHWLKNPGEALRILTLAPLVLFEGHDAPSLEISSLRGLGFQEVRLIGYSERLRGLYLASGRA